VKNSQTLVQVGFDFDGDHFYIQGIALRSTRNYLNLTSGADKIALVVDDIVTSQQWTPRCVRVYGTGTSRATRRTVRRK
jgi:pyridoxamine 5'-phosphate oxidase family protein